MLAITAATLKLKTKTQPNKEKRTSNNCKHTVDKDENLK